MCGITDFGKTVFLTRESAEQALSAINSHENEVDWDNLKGGAEI